VTEATQRKRGAALDLTDLRWPFATQGAPPGYGVHTSLHAFPSPLSAGGFLLKAKRNKSLLLYRCLIVNLHPNNLKCKDSPLRLVLCLSALRKVNTLWWLKQFAFSCADRRTSFEFLTAIRAEIHGQRHRRRQPRSEPEAGGCRERLVFQATLPS